MEEEKYPARRAFLVQAGTLAAATLAGGYLPGGTLAAQVPRPAAPLKNPLPRWKGFNLLDFFSPDPTQNRGGTSEEQLKWIADWGFDFIRLPMAYPSYVKFDRSKPITPEQVRALDPQATDRIEQLVYLAHKHNLHVSLNLHRAPGFCVNAGFVEPYNLWQDAQALDDFCYHWNFWATRFGQTSRQKISFDLLNEPCTREDMNDQHSRRGPVPGDQYRALALAASKAIRSVNPDHLIIADGNNVGNNVIPEITDLDIAQSCRGYNPGIISHYKAPWVFKDSSNLPEPKWPGQVGDQYLSRAMLEKAYEPWIELTQQGVGVHCGECGCWNKTPHEVFLAWFGDVLDVLKTHDIGFALWEFRGSFGLLDSGRDDVAYEDWHGHKLDRKLLTLLQKH
ncbi:cellulase family glycosylhydrolase [Rhabdobacter roseus]|uniref:Aryl-phospho-beta-D-glucosidase BglC (GH1 family) n=1 Tax=Rhabdobacter roseus TaxID=1655419 RepID=A0A840U1K0_9BACT|nr:cellulase family glycosylhydrolase [Rhabdobacter roseus]MBB5286248.1 aryl-phospho-beta-D-glucosidase BglC (GH1 family) [Rhabdobacter roseus]